MHSYSLCAKNSQAWPQIILEINIVNAQTKFSDFRFSDFWPQEFKTIGIFSIYIFSLPKYEIFLFSVFWMDFWRKMFVIFYSAKLRSPWTQHLCIYLLPFLRYKRVNLHLCNSAPHSVLKFDTPKKCFAQKIIFKFKF